MSVNSPYFGGPGHRLRVLAHPAVVDVAQRGADRGVRVAGGLPAHLRADDRQRRGARSGRCSTSTPGSPRGSRPLEVRVLDVVTDPEDIGLLAALVRALVETAAERWPAATSRRTGGARSCGPRGGGPLATALADDAARPGEPRAAPGAGGGRRPWWTSSPPRLDAAGDLDRVTAGVERVLGGDRRHPAAGGVRADRLGGGRRRRPPRPHRGRRGPPPTRLAEGLGSATWAKRSTHRSSPGPTARATARRSGAASTCSPGCCARRGSTPTTR